MGSKEGRLKTSLYLDIPRVKKRIASFGLNDLKNCSTHLKFSLLQMIEIQYKSVLCFRITTRVDLQINLSLNVSWQFRIFINMKKNTIFSGFTSPDI
jgi:hypothetical protein